MSPTLHLLLDVLHALAVREVERGVHEAAIPDQLAALPKRPASPEARPERTALHRIIAPCRNVGVQPDVVMRCVQQGEGDAGALAQTVLRIRLGGIGAHGLQKRDHARWDNAGRGAERDGEVLRVVVRPAAAGRPTVDAGAGGRAGRNPVGQRAAFAGDLEDIDALAPCGRFQAVIGHASGLPASVAGACSPLANNSPSGRRRPRRR